jgi:hypothetical protein
MAEMKKPNNPGKNNPGKNNAVKKIKKEGMDGAINTLYAVKKPYSGCTLTSLVQPIDPLVGLGGQEIVPDQIHAMYPDQDQANTVANQLYEEHCNQQNMLEEKKGQVGDKIKTAIDILQNKYKENLNLAKENPKKASEYKDKIATITTQIDDLVTKLQRIEKSKKEIEKKEEKKKEKKKEDKK